MTITEMKAINKEKGYCFFSKETIKFWNSRIHTAPNKYGLFIESHDNCDRTYKLYTVRMFLKHQGNIKTIEDAKTAQSYEHFRSLNDAKMFMHKLTLALNDACKCYRENAVLSDIQNVKEEGFRTGVYSIINTNGDSIEINTNAIDAENFNGFISG